VCVREQRRRALRDQARRALRTQIRREVAGRRSARAARASPPRSAQAARKLAAQGRGRREEDGRQRLAALGARSALRHTSLVDQTCFGAFAARRAGQNKARRAVFCPFLGLAASGAQHLPRGFATRGGVRARVARGAAELTSECAKRRGERGGQNSETKGARRERERSSETRGRRAQRAALTVQGVWGAAAPEACWSGEGLGSDGSKALWADWLASALVAGAVPGGGGQAAAWPPILGAGQPGKLFGDTGA